MHATTAEQSTTPLFDEYGLLKDGGSWNEQLALNIAKELGISHLSTDHWQIIALLRDHFARYGAAVAMHRVCREAGIERSKINELFGYCLNAWRVAGLPDPGEEAKSYLSNM